jgi:hypothetical protein
MLLNYMTYEAAYIARTARLWLNLRDSQDCPKNITVSRHAAPVQALQELNGVSRAETEPLGGTLVPRLRPPVAEIMTVVC